MKALLQRVTEAHVRVDDRIVGAIERGLLVLLGVAVGDGEGEADYLARKCANLRIFEDQAGKMNRSVLDVGGSVLVVSQFTLCADTSRGNRPGFSGAAPPEIADRLYQRFTGSLADLGLSIATGNFQTNMAVQLVNEGPVTILLERTP